MNNLEQTIQKYSHAYYCLDNPLVDDYTYDLLFRELQKQFPDSVLLNRIGSGICKELHDKR